MSASAQSICVEPAGRVDWLRALHDALRSRILDELEETRLLPARKVLYQFSARGHELTQVLLAQALRGPRDAASVYYRSRPLLLSLGLALEDALASTLMRRGGVSEGRDIGVVFNLPRSEGCCVLPACGGVGTQYTPAVGWAQAIRYHTQVLGDERFADSIAVAHGGEASTASNGFWAALNIATTQQLPLLFFIEDNGYGISVRADWQTPGGNVAANLRAFRGLEVLEGDAADPLQAAALIERAVERVRSRQAPGLLRLCVPRLSGHSGQDTQAYKSAEEIAAECLRDPLRRLRAQIVPELVSEAQWSALQQEARLEVSEALERAERRSLPDAASVTRYVFSESRPDGTPEPARQGGLLAAGVRCAPGTAHARPEGPRINMVTAIRRTLETELTTQPRMVVFGEDVGRKGGVHAATLGLQARFGAERVFDTSLSEEGIVGRAVGMALAGLLPVAEIQFRKYADSAAEQLSDCGSLRWRTANRFAAPLVVRIPGGFFRCGDPWHSQCNEVQFAHAVGWRLAMPSNAEDAVGLLRTALRGDDPTIFFEHRAMLDAAWGRRAYPGDDFVIPFGRACTVRKGDELTVISWGAMVERCEQAAQDSAVHVELIDLRTLVPWDRDCVLESVSRTRRCLIVHEDTFTAGFGAEIAATLSSQLFDRLEAPVERLAMPDIPSPHSPQLLEAALPSVSRIVQRIRDLASLSR
jgi:2-oxoisovalerate dehydrogenase E1 component